MFTTLLNIVKGKTKSEPKLYELWRKTVVYGQFIVQERSYQVGTFYANSESEAGDYANDRGGYAILHIQ